MTTYAVTADIATTRAPTDAAIGRLLELLAPLGVALAAGDGHVGWSATLTVEAPDPARAGSYALDELLHAAGEAKMPTGEVAALEVLTAAEADRRLDEPSFPELVGAAEAAEILGVSRQRVHQLHTENPRFPEPVVELRLGPLWLKASIDAFLRSWERKSGRPPREAVAAMQADMAGQVRAARRNSEALVHEITATAGRSAKTGRYVKGGGKAADSTSRKA